MIVQYRWRTIQKAIETQSRVTTTASSFNSHKRPRQNFFLQYLYNIKLINDEKVKGLIGVKITVIRGEESREFENRLPYTG